MTMSTLALATALAAATLLAGCAAPRGGPASAVNAVAQMYGGTDAPILKEGASESVIPLWDTLTERRRSR
jgi:hypothetical protein